MGAEDYAKAMAKHICAAHPKCAFAVRRFSSMASARARGIKMLPKAHTASEAGRSGCGGKSGTARGAPPAATKLATDVVAPMPGGSFLACGPSGDGDPVFEALAAAVTNAKAGHRVSGAVHTVDPPLCIPVSPAEHDATQLEYHRPGVPTCMSGGDCVGATLHGAPGPLSLYMTPDEAAHFKRTGTVPSAPHFCMLCMMAIYENMVIHTEAIVAASSGLESGHVVMPPFQHRVDSAGGYQSRYMVQSTGPTDRARLCLPIDVLSTTAPMTVEAMVPEAADAAALRAADPQVRYRVDLSAATWPPLPTHRHFLPRSASVTARD